MNDQDATFRVPAYVAAALHQEKNQLSKTNTVPTPLQKSEDQEPINAERQFPLPAWIVGDSTDVQNLTSGEYDFIFSCPPYYNLEVYSEEEGELSSYQEYSGFLQQYKTIINKTAGLLKNNRFACFVVGEVRDKHGNYHSFVQDTIEAFRDAGMEYYNEMILVNNNASLCIRVARQFNASRKIGKTHQNVLVFVKGDAKKATQEIGDVDVGELPSNDDTTGESGD